METKINLAGLGLASLHESSIKEITGGYWWIPGGLAVGLIISAINNFEDIREGFVDGYRGTPRY